MKQPSKLCRALDFGFSKNEPILPSDWDCATDLSVVPTLLASPQPPTLDVSRIICDKPSLWNQTTQHTAKCFIHTVTFLLLSNL